MYRAVFGPPPVARREAAAPQARQAQPTAWEVRERFQVPAEAPVAVEDDAQLCQICLELPRNVQNVPCGHLCCCRACGETLIARKAGCPLCRVPITGLRERAYTREGDTFLGPLGQQR